MYAGDTCWGQEDVEEAAKWYRKAADQGDENAKAVLKELSEE